MSQNPYEPAGYVSPEPSKPGAWRMQYLEMYQFVFVNPNWMTNFLWGGLCLLVAGVIPILPQLVFMGYQWEMVETLHRRQGRAYSDFDTNRIMDYLLRGVWPFLVSLVALMIGGLVLALLVGQQGGDALAFIAIAAWVLAVVALSLGASLFMYPLVLRAGLSQDFGQAFNFGWAMSFAKLMWKEIVVGTLFLFATSLGLCFVGLLVFCVGMYVAAIWIMFAHAHFYWQLYEGFLDRGGEPIPFKELPPPMMGGQPNWQPPQ
jgi:hypothetical protein